ncbi:ATPase [Herbivorax sp. ANBcel31]|uniref:ATPase n=1 Tax=Herbivorax sp. ANBcel31 TaxID=3069754 RepID=UPI0027B3C336|nr:ATPase [Herbivorax sp. ANBcel31]MDQ2085918.1 ATPase [Herbivorax sp. ANBcel31]
MVDPKNPGAVDEIIHLGDFWDEDGIRKNKDKIIKCNREVGESFKRAYRYIKAAYLIYEDNIEMIKQSVNIPKINQESYQIINSIFKDIEISDKMGKDRKLFASAIAPKGLVNYLSTILDTDEIYCVSGKHGTGTEVFLEKIKNAALERGFDVESFYCALNPSKLEHLIIRELDISFTTSNEYHSANIKFSEYIDFDKYIEQFSLNELVLEENKQNFDFLLGLGIKNIAKAKSIHDDMEAYYIPNMDFEAVQLCLESTMAKIL